MSKSILITGASSGFGRDAALRLAEAGHTVFATMRGVSGKNAGEAASLREQADANGWNLSVLELDVTDDASIETAVTQVIDHAGSLDVLINNAGVGSFGVQETFTPEQVKQLFEVNVFGVLRMNRAALPPMRERGAGLIVYLSSGLGRVLLPFIGPYAASKFALEALAEAASYELKPLGIHTHIIQPGAYGTSFSENMMEPADAGRTDTYGEVNGMFQSFAEGFSSMEAGDPREVVEAIVDAVEAERPELRRPVGDDMKRGVEAINQTSAEVQKQTLAALGMG